MVLRLQNGIKQTTLRPYDIANFIFKELPIFYQCHTIDNVVAYIEKALEVNQLLLFIKDNDIKGVFSWILIDEDTKKTMGKNRWVFQKNLNNGNIIYVPFCIINDGSIFAIKKYFNENNLLKNIKEFYWHKIKTKKIYIRRLKWVH